MHGAKNIKFYQLNYNHDYDSGWLIDRSVDGLVICPAGWLAAWLVGWMDGWMVS
jgi:hypothetical protein